MAYDVGKILVKIESQSRNVTKNIDKVISSLENLDKKIRSVEKLKNFELFDTKDYDKTLNSAKKSINGFANSMGKLDKKMNEINFDSLERKFISLSASVEPFLNRIKSAEPVLKNFVNAMGISDLNSKLAITEARINAINQKAQSKKVIDNVNLKKAQTQLKITEERLKKVQNGVNKVNSSSKKMAKGLLDFGKLYVMFNYARRYANVFKNIITSAIDYNETMNKFQVSMGDYYEQALGFVNNITRAFNLSSESIMNYQATFKNMLDALKGLDEGVSYQLSETLTRQAIDFASLFNVSVERAMSVFQNALSGQVRSIRAISGYDVTQNTYYSVYQSLGGTKSVRQLTQLEKRLLVILSIQKQMEETGAVGDFTKTINYTANQLKQLSETFKEITMYIGQFALYYLKPFIEQVLGFAIAIREVLAIAYESFEGKDIEEEIKGISNTFESASENVDDLADSVESVKKTLLGFDELNVLGATDSGILGSDVELIASAIGKYSGVIDDVKSKASDISKELLTWFGYSQDINGEWAKDESLPNNLDRVLGTIKSIGIALGGIMAYKIGVSAISSLGKIFTSLSSINLKAGLIGGAIALIGLSLLDAYNNNKQFRASIDELFANINEDLETLKPVFDFLGTHLQNAISKAFVNLTKRISELVNAFAEVYRFGQKIASFFEQNGGFWVTIENWFKGLVNNVILGVQDFINIIIDSLNNWIGIINQGLSFFGLENIDKISNVSFDLLPTSSINTNGYETTSNAVANTDVSGAITQSMLPIANAITSGTGLTQMQTPQIILEVNGRKFAEATYDDYEKVANRKSGGGNTKLSFTNS